MIIAEEIRNNIQKQDDIGKYIWFQKNDKLGL